MKVKRRSGELRVDLGDVESTLLAGLIDDFSELLQTPAGDEGDPVLERLFPDGYTDDDAGTAEFREMVESDLRSERTGRLQLCRAEIPEGGGRFTLDDEAADRWLRVINDLRLALGTRLGVTEEIVLDDSEPAVSIYHWLSAVQELIVDNVMG